MRLTYCLLLVVYATSLFAQCETGNQKDREYYSLYREFYLQKNYEDALPYCRRVIRNAPGLRKTTFHNAAVMYGTLFKAGDSLYVDTLIRTYQHQMRCWGDSVNLLQKIAALQIAMYPDRHLHSLDLIRTVHAIDSSAPATRFHRFWFNMELQQLAAGKISSKALLEHYHYLMARTDSVSAKWIAEKLPDSLRTCELLDQRASPFSADSLKNWKLLLQYRKLGCKKEEGYKKLLQHFVKTSPNTEALKYYLYSKSDQDHLQLVSEVIALARDSAQLREMHLFKIKALYLDKQYKAARDLAFKVMMQYPDLGEIYMLIGDVYLASLNDKSCSEKDRMLLVLLTLDYYQKALGTESDEPAKERIAKYERYMPTKTQLFWYGIHEGDIHQFGCWINEKVVVRAKSP